MSRVRTCNECEEVIQPGLEAFCITKGISQPTSQVQAWLCPVHGQKVLDGIEARHTKRLLGMADKRKK